MAFEVFSLLEATVADGALSEDHGGARKSATHHSVQDMTQIPVEGRKKKETCAFAVAASGREKGGPPRGLVSPGLSQ